MKLDHDASTATAALGANVQSTRASLSTDHQPKPPLPPPSPPPPLPAPHHLYGSSSTKSPRFAARKTKQLVHSSSSSLYRSQSDASNASHYALSALQHRLCHQFAARGTCAYGARCRYSHELRPPPVPLSVRPPFPGEYAPRAVVVAAPVVGYYPPPCWIPPTPTPSTTNPHSIPVKKGVPQTPAQLGGSTSKQTGSATNSNAIKSTLHSLALPPTRDSYSAAVLRGPKASSTLWTPPAKVASSSDQPEPEAPTSTSSCSSVEKENAHCQQPKRLNDCAQSCTANKALPVSCKKAPVSHKPSLSIPHVSSKPLRQTPYGSVAKSCDSKTRELRTPSTLISSAYPISPALSSASWSGNYSLSSSIDAFVDRLDAELSTLEVIQQHAVAQLQAVVHSLWVDGVVDVYGSNYTRLALPQSDVDCVLSSRTLAERCPSAVLQQLAAAVRETSWAKRVDLVACAKIPVLKVVFGSATGDHDVMLDLTCGHSVGHSGLSARDLIYSLQAEMPALRPLVLVLKAHLQQRGLNCAFTGGLSSYALVLLVIRFLQACGDEHLRTFNPGNHAIPLARRRHFVSSTALLSHVGRMSKWVYTFARDGKVVWKTAIGNLLLLFLETYATFDYRRFGVSIEHGGEFFVLPPTKVAQAVPEMPMNPYIADPITPGRRIGNAFRMTEIVEAWCTLYKRLVTGVSLADAIAKQPPTSPHQ